MALLTPLAAKHEDMMSLTEQASEARWRPSESRRLRRAAFEPLESPEDQARDESRLDLYSLKSSR